MLRFFPSQPALWVPPISATGLWNITGGPQAKSLKEIAEDRKRQQKKLWHRSTAKRTTEAVPERTRTQFVPSNEPLPKVSGSLWQKKQPERPKGLWQRQLSTKTVAPDILPPRVPLWSKNSASRTTKLKPERSEKAKKPRKLPELQKALGPLWAKPVPETPAPLWKPPQLTRLPSLWTPTDPPAPKPPRTHTPCEEEKLPATPTTLWLPPKEEEKDTLWQLPKEEALPSPSSNPLWSKETAKRTTQLRPTRSLSTPRKDGMTFEKAVGMLWGQQQPLDDLPSPGLSRSSTVSSISSVEELEDDASQATEDVSVRIKGQQQGEKMMEETKERLTSLWTGRELPVKAE